MAIGCINAHLLISSCVLRYTEILACFTGYLFLTSLGVVVSSARASLAMVQARVEGDCGSV